MVKTGALGIMALMLLVGFTGTATDDNGPGDYTCDASVTYTLYGGQTIDVGEVMVWHDTETLFIRYTTDGDWWLSETHVFVGDDIDYVPTTGKQNNPKIGQFPYSMDHDPMVQVYTYELDLVDDLGWEKGDVFAIMTHAVVMRIVDDEVVQGETGWAGDRDFESQRWAYWFDYKPCKILMMPDDDVSINFDPGVDSYFQTIVTDGGNDVPDDTYLGWCIDEVNFVNYVTDYDATLISSYDPFLSSYFSGSDDRWDLNWEWVNYILNMKDVYMDDWGVSSTDIQHALWIISGDRDYNTQSANAQAVYDDAEEFGDGFYPASGEWMAIVVYISSTNQLTFIEVDP